MRILGIDPGLRLTGYGCIDADGPDVSLVEGGVLRLGVKRGPRSRTESTLARNDDIDLAPLSDAKSVSARLAELDRDVRALLERLRPRLVAVESIFAHYKHPATAIIMGHARGVILLAIEQARVELMELKPNEIKKSLTGHGHAAKGGMQRAIQARFNLPEPPSPPDVADALAIALCAAGRLGSVALRPDVASQIPPRKRGQSRRRPTLADVQRLVERSR